MQTLIYGYKLPETNDWGSIFFPALVFDISRLNDHNHDGANSAALSAGSLSVSTGAILSTGWGSVLTNGGYKQAITLPGLFTYDGRNISFRKATTGEILYLQTEKISSNSYYVYSNDNTLNATIIYT